MVWGGAGRCPVQREARVPSSGAASSVGGEQGAVGGQVHAAGAQASALRTEALGALEKNTVPMSGYLQSTPMAQSCHPTSCTPCLASQDSPGAAVTHSSAAFAPKLWLSFAGREVGTWKQDLQIWGSGLRRGATSSGVLSTAPGAHYCAPCPPQRWPDSPQPHTESCTSPTIHTALTSNEASLDLCR